MAGGECGLLRRRWRGRRCRRPGLPVTVYLALLYTLSIGVAVCGGRTIDLSEYGAHVYHPMPGAVVHGGAPLCIAMNVTHTPSQPDPATGARHTSTMLPAALDPVLAACLYVSGAEACSNVTTIAFAVAPEVTYSIQGRVRAAQDASLAGPLSPAFHIRTGAVDPPCVPRDRPRKLFSCIPFNTELDMLRLHLEHVYDYVDHIIVVEAPLTFAGAPKPLHLRDNLHLFTEYRHKLHPAVWDDVPRGLGVELDWVRDRGQRGVCLSKMAELGADDDDLVLVVDTDEIPNARVLRRLRECSNVPEPAFLGFRQHIYAPNWRDSAADYDTWFKAAVTTVAHAQRHGPSFIRSAGFCPVRGELAEHPYLGRVIPNAGWHLSYFFPPRDISSKLKEFAHASEYTKFADNMWWLCARQLVGRMVRKQEQLTYLQYPDVPPGLRPHRPDLARPRTYHGFFFGGRQEGLVEGQTGARVAPLLSNPLAPPPVPMVAQLCGAPMEMAGEWAEGVPVPRPLRERLDEYWLHASLAVSANGLLSSGASLGEQVLRLLTADVRVLAARTRYTAPLSAQTRPNARHTAGVLAVHATLGTGVDCGVTFALVDAVSRAACMPGDAECALPGQWGGRVLVTEAVAVGVPINGTRAQSWRSPALQSCASELASAGVAHMVHTPPYTGAALHASHVAVGREVDVVVVDASQLQVSQSVRSARRLHRSASAEWLGDRGFNEGWECGSSGDGGAPMALAAATVAAEVGRWWDKVAVNGSLLVVLPAGATRDLLSDGSRACVPVSGVAGVEVAVGAVTGSGGDADRAGSRWMAHSHGPGVRISRMLVSAGGRVSRGDAGGRAWWVLRATRAA